MSLCKLLAVDGCPWSAGPKGHLRAASTLTHGAGDAPPGRLYGTWAVETRHCRVSEPYGMLGFALAGRQCGPTRLLRSTNNAAQHRTANRSSAPDVADPLL